MGSSLDEFKNFVKRNPGLNQLVTSRRKTWQEIYEEWTFYPDDERWDRYKDPNSKTLEHKEVTTNSTNQIDSTSNIKNEKNTVETPTADNSSIEGMMKNALNYVKKINPDTVTKTVTNAQKILALISGLGAGSLGGIAKSTKTGDPLFDKRFDEWY